ncbi:MAG: 4Fe-4S dicluster domain-containing protein [Planctomycetaceae bacterium]|nr:4Fe-4S dicluster domain-containing protein [Planctomycetaceae bacterium]
MKEPLFLPREEFPTLIARLLDQGYRVIAPTVDQGAIVYAEIQSVDSLPRGWTDEQQPGRYRLKETGNSRCFDFAVGPHSWKQFLFPPLQRISTAIKGETGWTFAVHEPEIHRYAFLGVRACELAGMRVQDRVFLERGYVDTAYEARRQASLVIAVNCAVPSANCFCTSMQTGPRCEGGYDLALTELDEGFVLEVGSAAGEDVLADWDLQQASAERMAASREVSLNAARSIQKTLDTQDLRDRLMAQLEHPHWQEVGERCLSCTNCTMVCPTCFCSHVTEVSDLDQQNVERERRWDSCFHLDFSMLHGRPVRNDIRSRYRQWLTHKLATWHDQFGESGCVGCGRCITWCPVGIDLTVEVKELCRDQP